MTKLSTRLFAEVERRPGGVQYYSSSGVDSGRRKRCRLVVTTRYVQPDTEIARYACFSPLHPFSMGLTRLTVNEVNAARSKNSRGLLVHTLTLHLFRPSLETTAPALPQTQRCISRADLARLTFARIAIPAAVFPLSS